jgi:hypothetical protein
MKQLVAAILMALTAAPFAAQSRPLSPRSSNHRRSRSPYHRTAVQQAIAEKNCRAPLSFAPGAIASGEKAIGNRAPYVSRADDARHDLRSGLAHKGGATTTSVMILPKRKIRLTDRVSTFIPGFER